jgi:hypothetical protein
MAAQPTGRRAARLALIDAEQDRLAVQDAAANDEDWNEASQFNLDHRNAQWHRLDDERRTTLAA